MELHRNFRDEIAPLEASLATLLRARGFRVVGVHSKTGLPDSILQAEEAERVFLAEFNEATS